MSKLTINLEEAWLQRAIHAAGTIGVAQGAPALFKPEAVDRARTEYDRALEMAARMGGAA